MFHPEGVPPVRHLDDPDISPRYKSGQPLKGQAVELWRDGRGFFLVADEVDAQEAMARFGAGRGQIWTSSEIELVASIPDQPARDELETFRRQLNGSLSPDAAGKGTPWPGRHGLKGRPR